VGDVPRDLHRNAEGYTSNPTQTMRAEPEALTVDQPDELAIRDRQARADDWAHQRGVIYSRLAEAEPSTTAATSAAKSASSSTASRGSASCSGSDPRRESGRRFHP
jgi:hypothetical protein